MITLIVEMKQKKPSFGYLRMLKQIYHAFGIKVDKGVVKRVLDKHYKPKNSKQRGTSLANFSRPHQG